MPEVSVVAINPKTKHMRDINGELVIVSKPLEAHDAGVWVCYVCSRSQYAVVRLSPAEEDNWFVCAQCLFNGVREGYFRVVHQGQQDEVVEAFVPEKPIFNEDGTTSIGDITVAWD